MPRPLSRTVTQPSAAELHLDPAGMAGDRLVHRVVERLGGEVMQRALVGAADIHAGPAAHRLQPFEDLDVLGRIAVVVELSRQIIEEVGHAADYTEGPNPRKQDAVYLSTGGNNI